jgi:hypothetical protein
MAERVKPARRQACRLGLALERSQERLRMERSPELVGEDQACVGPHLATGQSFLELMLAVLPQGSDRFGIDRYSGGAVIRLGGRLQGRDVRDHHQSLIDRQ